MCGSVCTPSCRCFLLASLVDAAVSEKNVFGKQASFEISQRWALQSVKVFVLRLLSLPVAVMACVHARLQLALAAMLAVAHVFCGLFR
jgi:hypothetical protein